MKKSIAAVLVSASLFVFSVTSSAQKASFDQLKDTSAFTFSNFALSADGKTMAVNANGEIFVWTARKGFVDLGPGGLSSSSIGISADGTTIVADRIGNDGVDSPARWTASAGWTDLGHPSNGCTLDGSWGSGYGVSGNGAVAIGLAWVCTGQAEGFRWDTWHGIASLGHPKGASSRASAISEDASTIVGFYENPQFGFRRAVRWTAGKKDLIAGAQNPGEATAVSSDGSQVVGQVVLGFDPGYAFYFTDQSGVLALGSVANNGIDPSFANGVSDDGKVIGFSGNRFGDGLQAFIWDAKFPKKHMQLLAKYLVKKGAKVPGGVVLLDALSISADGSTIVGTWVDAQFNGGVWIANLK